MTCSTQFITHSNMADPIIPNNTNIEASLDTKFAPSAINLTSSDLQIANRFIRTLFISTLPRFLGSNWFSQIINLDRILDISIYVHPDDPGRVLKRLRDKLGRLQAQAMDESEQGKVRNPILDTAIGDIEDLRDKIQQGTDKFFQFGLYITLYADSVKDLDDQQAKIKGLLDAQLIYTKPATFRMNEVFIIDPENEYKYLAETVGGSIVNISIASDSHINPFDLPTPQEDESFKDVFRTHVLDMSGLFRLMLGQMSPEEESLLDEAIIHTYAIKDITMETTVMPTEVPLLSDFKNVLDGLRGAESLVNRIKKYTDGTFSGFLNHPTNVALDKKLVVFSIRDMEEELKPIAMYLVLNYIWAKVRSQKRRRILAVDEAWWLLKYEAGGAFLFNIAKRARKYFLGLTTISQDVADFLGSQYGKAIVTNSSLQLLLKQSPASIDLLQQTFNLTDSEKFYLLESPVGQGLFFAGTNHVGIRVVASYTEDQIITSDPRQIMEIEKAKQELAQAAKS